MNIFHLYLNMNEDKLILLIFYCYINFYTFSALRIKVIYLYLHFFVLFNLIIIIYLLIKLLSLILDKINTHIVQFY